MAKEQKHGNREAKKPKTAVKKPASDSAASPFQTPPKTLPGKGGGGHKAK